MADSPEHPEGSPNPGYTSPAPPPFQPVAPPFQPVSGGTYQSTGIPGQPAAAPAKAGGNNTLKIILIVVGVLVVLVMLVVGVIGYGVWRVSRAIHKSGENGMTINTPSGAITTGPSQSFSSSDLGTDIYPGATAGKGGMRMTLPTGPIVAANYLTSDSKDQVIAFYKNKFGSQAQTMESDDGAVMTVKKSPQDSVMVTITQKPSQHDGKTQIHIMHTINNKAS